MNPLEYIRQRSQTTPVEAPKDARPRLIRLEGIRAVIFDIYGTLFSSGVGDISLATEQNQNDALRKTLLDHNIQLSDTGHEQRLDQRLQNHIREHHAVRHKAGIEYPEVDIRDVWKDFLKELYKENWIQGTVDTDVTTLSIDYETRINPVQLMPGLEKTLASLRERKLFMSLISNAQFYTPLLFEALLGQSYEELGLCPDCAVWSYQLLEAKPSTKLYEVSAVSLYKRHNIVPKEVLYVGNDMRNDIWPAQEIGFKTALFAGDQLSLRRREKDPQCRNVRPDLEITELMQLNQCI